MNKLSRVELKRTLVLDYKREITALNYKKSKNPALNYKRSTHKKNLALVKQQKNSALKYK